MAKIKWINSSGGTWSVGSNWSQGNVPGPNDKVTISVAPGQGLTGYTVDVFSDVVVKSVTLDQAAATLMVGDGYGDGLLASRVTLDAGTLALQSGTLSGLVDNVGGTLALTSPYYYDYGTGTLSSVTWQGNLQVEGYGGLYGGSLTVVGGLNLSGVNGVGPGTLTLTQGNFGANFVDTQTLDNATVFLGSTSYNASSLISTSDGNAPANLTLGTNLVLDIVGNASLAGLGQITNEGTISTTGTATAVISGDYSTVATFSNNGVMDINANGDIVLGASTIVNSGSLTVAAGGTLDLSFQYLGITSFQNTGSLLDDGTVTLDGTLTTATVQALGISYGATGSLTLSYNSTLDNTGDTLLLGNGGVAPSFVLQGTIEGGTISEAGGGLIAEDGVLSGVTLEGPLALTGTYSTLYIENGLQLQPGTTLSVTGPGDSLNFVGAQTLSQATIVLGSQGGDSLGDEGGTLTLDSTVQTEINTGTVTFSAGGQTGTVVNQGLVSVSGDALAGFGIYDSGFVNQGTISVTGGSTVFFDSYFTNTGAISVTDSTLVLGSVSASLLSSIHLTNSRVEIAGSVTATGTTLNVGTGTNLGQVVIGVTSPIYNGYVVPAIEGGTLHDAGGGLLLEGYVSLTDVTYQGVLSVSSPFSNLSISNLDLQNEAGTGPGTLVLSGAQSVLSVGGATPLDNATIDIGSSVNHQGNTRLAAPTIKEQYGSGSPVLNLGAHLLIDQTAKYAAIGGASLGDETNSAATIDAAVKGGQMLLDGGYFTSSGSIDIGAGETVTSAAGSFTNSGTVAIGAGGTLALNLLNYYLLLPASGTSFENSGQIVLAGGSLIEQTAKGIPAVPLRNDAGGNISGVGVVAAEIDNGGTITAVGGGLTVSQAVSGGGGVLDVAAGATLSLLSSVSEGQVAQFGGAGGVLGLSAKQFLGDIGGFAKGDTIDLLKLAASAAEFSGSSIVVTLTHGGTISLTTTEPLSGALTVSSDGHGGSLIAFAGATPHAAIPAYVPPHPMWEAIAHHYGF